MKRGYRAQRCYREPLLCPRSGAELPGHVLQLQGCCWRAASQGLAASNSSDAEQKTRHDLEDHELHEGLLCRLLLRKHILFAPHDIHSSIESCCTVSALAVLGWHEQALENVRAIAVTRRLWEDMSQHPQVGNMVQRSLHLIVVLSNKIGKAFLNGTDSYMHSQCSYAQ